MWNITLSGFADEIDMSLEKQMEVLRKLDMHYIEMRGVNGKALVDWPYDEVKNIKKQLDENGFHLSSVGSPIGKIMITDPFEEHFEKFRKTVEIAHICDTRNIRIFSFYIPEHENPSDYRDEVMDRLGRMSDYAAEEDVVLLHENEKKIYGDTAPRCLDIMRNFYGPHFKAVFDFANFVQCGQDTKEAYEMLKPCIAYVHVKDALLESGKVVPAGMGDGNVREILGRLRESGYEGFLSIEPHLTDFTGFGTLGDTKSIGSRKLTGEESFTLAYRSLTEILKDMET